MDPVSVENCKKRGLEAEMGDATNYEPKGDEAVVCFNLVLHHLVVSSFLCEIVLCQFLEERQILTHFSYRV